MTQAARRSSVIQLFFFLRFWGSRGCGFESGAWNLFRVVINRGEGKEDEWGIGDGSADTTPGWRQ
jgi:hypothetical protein